MLRARGLAVLMLVLASELLMACGEDLPDPPAGPRRIRIGTADGERLTAIEVGRGRRVAVLSHGVTGTKEDFYGLASALAADGWRVFACDTRGAGTSTGAPEADRELRGSIPVFVAAARENEPFTTDARAIAAVLAVSPTIVDGNGHGSGMLRDHPELIEEILAFADGSVSGRP
jgi:pimeloyl-ACP methyl ester carboxylesterase